MAACVAAVSAAPWGLECGLHVAHILLIRKDTHYMSVASLAVVIRKLDSRSAQP